jgi:hypothetical protein
LRKQIEDFQPILEEMLKENSELSAMAYRLMADIDRMEQATTPNRN